MVFNSQDLRDGAKYQGRLFFQGTAALYKSWCHALVKLSSCAYTHVIAILTEETKYSKSK